MVFGGCFYTLLVGTMSTFLAAMDTKGHEIAEKEVVINEFCKQAHIEAHLRGKMKTAIQYKSKNDYFSAFEEGSFLEHASQSLKYKVKLVFAAYNNILKENRLL